MKSFSKYDEAYIKKKAIKLIKLSNYEDVSSDSDGGIPPMAIYEKILDEIKAILKEEEESKDEGIPFKISEPYNVASSEDSEVPDTKSEDCTESQGTESDDCAESQGTESDDCAESQGTESDDCVESPDTESEDTVEPPDTKSEDCVDAPRYGIVVKMDAYGELRQRVGRLTPTTLEDDLLKKELGKVVYGAKADAICGQETLMISKFDRVFDMTEPKLWPVAPIDP